MFKVPDSHCETCGKHGHIGNSNRQYKVAEQIMILCFKCAKRNNAKDFRYGAKQ